MRFLKAYAICGGICLPGFFGGVPSGMAAESLTDGWPRNSEDARQWFAERKERLFLEELSPERVEASEDFFADPVWGFPGGPFSSAQKKKLGELDRLAAEFRREGRVPDPVEARILLEELREYDGVLEKIGELGARSGANSGWEYARGYDARQPQLEALVFVARALRLRAEANLGIGATEAAGADARLVFRLARSLAGEPQLLSLLVVANLQDIGRQILLAGRGRWSAEDLPELAADLAAARPSRGLPNALRGERGAFNHQRRELVRVQYPVLAGKIEKSGAVFYDPEHLFYNLAMQLWIDALEKSPFPPDATLLADVNRDIESLRRLHAESSLDDNRLGGAPRLQFPVLAGLIARILDLERAQQDALPVLGGAGKEASR